MAHHRNTGSVTGRSLDQGEAVTSATTKQLNDEITARKAADAANAAAITAEGKARLAGDKLNADAIAALTARVAALEGSMANVILRVAAVEAHFAPPAPLGRPFSAPLTTGTYTVPGTINHTGSADAAAALNTFIGTVPDGSIIAFAIPGAVYRLDVGLLFAARHNLVIEGYETTTLNLNSAGNLDASSSFLLRGSTHIAIHGFTVIGNNPNTTTLYNSGYESQHVLGLSGWYGGAASSYVEIGSVIASHIFGDGVYVEGQNVSPYGPSDSVWVHDNTFSYIGRNGISSIDVTNLLIDRNSFDKIGMDVWDIEPNVAPQVVHHNTFRNNTVGRYGYIAEYIGWFVSTANPTGGSPIHDLAVTGNTVIGNPAEGYDGTPRGLNSRFANAYSPRTINVTFTGNSTAQTVAGPVLVFAHVDGLDITGNTQPLSSGSLASITDCTAVVGP
jgi:hypothetical protein